MSRVGEGDVEDGRAVYKGVNGLVVVGALGFLCIRDFFWIGGNGEDEGEGTNLCSGDDRVCLQLFWGRREKTWVWCFWLVF